MLIKHYNFKISHILKTKHLFFVTFFCFILCGCINNSPNPEPKALYNEKANEIIAQIIKDQECKCIFSIPKRSLIAMAHAYSPFSRIEDKVIEKLKLRGKKELDSLTDLSQEFKLNPQTLKKNDVRVISLEDYRDKNDSVFKICPNGVLSIQKPIFDRHFKRSVIDYDWALSCMRGPILTFEFKNNTWVLVEN